MLFRSGEAILPKAGELHATDRRAQLGVLVSRSMGLALLLAGGFCIGGIYFGEMLVKTWIGFSYPETPLVLGILLGAQVVAMPMVIVRKALLGSGEVRITALIDLLEAVLNLILSLILIRFWGIVGVAAGTPIPLAIVETTLLLPYAARRLSITSELLLKQVLLPVLPSLAALWLFCELLCPKLPPTGWLPLLGATAGGGVILLGTRGLIAWWERLEIPATPGPVVEQSA